MLEFNNLFKLHCIDSSVQLQKHVINLIQPTQRAITISRLLRKLDQKYGYDIKKRDK